MVDVPDSDQLLGRRPLHQPLACHLTFFAADQRPARETVRFAAGQCVGYPTAAGCTSTS